MPKKVNHQERKHEIAEAALHMIHQNGIANTTLREIAKEVGLSLGSVQYYFQKQEDLYEFTMDLLYKRTEDRIRNVLVKNQSAFENAVSMLTQMVQVQDEQQRMENDIWAQICFVPDKSFENEELKERFHQSYAAFVSQVVNQVIEMLHDTRFLYSQCLEAEAKTLSFFMDGLMLNTIIYPNHYDEQTVKAQIREYLFKICR